ncbi:MSMEG_1061 family FMN-dependent PPOX-type flavoprotein [Jannaschia sp. M317]|uniref:MSMEG_1061 family FMN-dependent PPOX-type flavoprotein n=1 Tax=Jannaschia sp. M317 TaxID=2867011 RepID=UPI0021A520C7|nr:MSMEG_1061 family FMN-dependent PPOX-type flavoprotein [Jannaschia sp. M317]UWQ17911.1 pyridoxamine 5'-phosphate oxidase family protein [Jannaschia sp. M317]
MAVNISNPIRTEPELRAVLPRWTGNASRKDADHVNEVARAFIARSPFCVLSTSAADGRHDVSPRGDAPGFVTVHDDRTLLIPDRLGNHRLDSFENLLTNPQLGLLFTIPGHKDTLRIAGTGRIAADDALRAPFAINGRLPDLVLVVHVTQVFMHCAKAYVRSRLWHPESWTLAGGAPTLAEWVKSVVETDQSLHQVQKIHSEDEATRLY